MNNITLKHWSGTAWEEIDNIVFPLTTSDLLDERLDEAFVSFYSSQREQYKPTDIFVLGIVENVENVEDVIEAKKQGFCLAMDTVKEIPLGSGRFKHDLSLIEPTKLAEGIMCQTLTFTNNLGNIYTANAKVIEPDTPEIDDFYSNLASGHTDFKLNIYNPSASPFKLPSLSEIGVKFADHVNSKYKDSESNYSIELTDYSPPTLLHTSLTINGETSTDQSKIISLTSGTYVISYRLIYKVYFDGEFTNTYDNAQFDFTLICVENKYPLLPYTITDAVCRCLELAEPLQTSEKPRIVFGGVSYLGGVGGTKTFAPGSQAEKYSTVFAPEMAITQANLREQLKRIGGFIHSEPRIIIDIDSDSNTPTFKVIFDEIIGRKEADLSKAHLTERNISRSINDYNTELRANAANIVNTLDYDQGVVTEPYVGGYRTLRSDINQRTSEENGYAPTGKGIYAITKVMCGIKNDDATGWAYRPVDITAYVLERCSYDLLSDYDKDFPDAKSLALYYTQGQEGIHGLFYRSTAISIATPYTKAAIVRILARELQVSEDAVESKIIDAKNGIGKLAMQISYIPIYENMLSHGKRLYVPNETPFAQAFAQGDNLIETRYFGENIKSTAARLGNVEESRNYAFKSVSDVPKAGETIGDYVISSVSKSIMPTYTKATLTLSKHFNKISEYVGIDSHKRVYEVSEREAHERHVLIKHKLVFSTDSTYKGGNNAHNAMGAFYEASGSAPNIINAVKFNAFSFTGGDIGSTLLLPIVSSAFGNIMTFTFTTKDNYSAGSKIVYREENAISGYWAQDIPYADYYGRIAKVNLEFFEKNALRDATDNSNTVPEWSGDNPTTENALYRLNNMYIDKDSREHLSFTYEIEACTTDDDLIIGSGFASGNPLVTTNKRKAVLYLYDKPFTEFDTVLSDNPGTTTYKYPVGQGYTYSDNTISFDTPSEIPSGKAVYWALAYPQYVDKETKFEDKYGNIVTSATVKGGEILLASKTPVVADKPIHESIYVTLKNK